MGLRFGAFQSGLYPTLFVCLWQGHRRCWLRCQTRLSGRITCARLVSRCGTPGIPATGLATDVLQQHAIDRTHRQTEFAAGAFRLDDCVHAFVRADNGVDRAGVYAQSAAYAPVLVNPNHAARCFQAVQRVEFDISLACDGRQPLHAFSAARRALVDPCVPVRNGVCVRSAVGVAATRALRLRQYIQNALSRRHCIQAVARRRLLAGAVLFLLTVLPGALTAGFFTAAFLGLGWCACMKDTISG